MKGETPKIPVSLKGFAESVALLAQANGIKGFEMKADVEYEHRNEFEPEPVHSGEVKVVYRAKDGRGRPSRGLKVYYDSRTTVTLLDEPESY